MGARADVAHGRLRRFLHHVAQLAGDGQLAFAFHQRASVVRIWPPTSVQASPRSRPLRSSCRRSRSRNFYGPSRSGSFSALITDLAAVFLSLPLWLQLTTWRAILRQTLPISRSRLRTPASRV